MKPNTDEFNKQAEAISRELFEMFEAQGINSDVNFDYAYGATPSIDFQPMYQVDCSRISEEDFEMVNDHLERVSIEGKGYHVYAMLNDSGGYAYWRDQDEPLYVMIVATITDITQIDVERLADDMLLVREKLWRFDAIDA